MQHALKDSRGGQARHLEHQPAHDARLRCKVLHEHHASVKACNQLLEAARPGAMHSTCQWQPWATACAQDPVLQDTT